MRRFWFMLAVIGLGSGCGVGGLEVPYDESPESVSPQVHELTVSAGLLDDSYIRSGIYASTNYGPRSALQVKQASALDETRMAYLKFDLSAVTTPLGSAKLRLYGTSVAPSALHVAIFEVHSATWQESTVTWNNRPQPRRALAAVSIAAQRSGWYEWDVTYIVRKALDGPLTEATSALGAITKNTSEPISFASSEAGANQPVLMLEVDDPKPTDIPPGASHYTGKWIRGLADLGTLPSGMSITWPAAPVTTRARKVSTAAEFNAEARINDTQITVTGNINDGDCVIDASNIDVVAGDFEVQNLAITHQRHHIRVTGGRYDYIYMYFPLQGGAYNASLQAHDVLFDAVSVNNPEGEAFNLTGYNVALINSTIRAAQYTMGDADGDGNRTEDRDGSAAGGIDVLVAQRNTAYSHLATFTYQSPEPDWIMTTNQRL